MSNSRVGNRSFSDYTLYLEYGKVDCVPRESLGYTMSLRLQCINDDNQGLLMRGKETSIARD